jgi:hypothetical protein
MESGKLLPGVKVIIANPETKGQCGDSHLGEVCICTLYLIFMYSLPIHLFHAPDHRTGKGKDKVFCGV